MNRIVGNTGGGLASWALAMALGPLAAGCGGPPQAGNTPNVSSGGLSLPAGFVPVALPEATRKAIFAEVHGLRARAVQQANAKLPMDEASLPKGDTAAFDRRVADHKALIDAFLAEQLPALAARSNISEADLAKIEDEARILRWIPPQDPTDDDATKDD
ncbi:MAG: hypothetical protein U0800_19990 [Isosphaeraceae bacterium]